MTEVIEELQIDVSCLLDDLTEIKENDLFAIQDKLEFLLKLADEVRQ
jgi:hypothetical protein